MVIFELRKKGDGYELSGGQLTAPLQFPEKDAFEYATRMVGFLAQVTGAELHVYDSRGMLAVTKTFREGVRPTKGELGNS
jgi:hypothetical protein